MKLLLNYYLPLKMLYNNQFFQINYQKNHDILLLFFIIQLLISLYARECNKELKFNYL